METKNKQGLKQVFKDGEWKVALKEEWDNAKQRDRRTLTSEEN